MVSSGVAAIVTHFETLTDPRVERTRQHRLLDMIVIALCATIAGADGWADVERFGKAKRAWFARFLELSGGIPSHDTFGRVFARLDTPSFMACLMDWLRSLHLALAGEGIAIDGKTLRRSFEEKPLQELVASIRRLGIIQAISVRYMSDEDVYEIVNGERRYQAAKVVGLAAMPCLVTKPEDREILPRQIAENWVRAALHPFELADSLAQLRDDNKYTQRLVAELIGKSEAEVSKFLKLLDLAPDVQKEARADPTGVLSFKHLYQIARVDPAEQTAIAETVREQRLSAVETEKLVRKTIERHTATPKRGAPVTRVQYVTTKAKVLLMFRKQSVLPADILAALDEAREKAAASKDSLNIVRQPK